MKYLFFIAGLLLMVGGTAAAIHGTINGWDASIVGAPMIIGFILILVGVVFAGMEFDEKSEKK